MRKKILAILLMVSMMISMGVPVFATVDETTTPVASEASEDATISGESESGEDFSEASDVTKDINMLDAEMSVTPETLGAPETTEIPGTTETPGTTENPDAPGTTENPDAPETTETPNTPETSENPEVSLADGEHANAVYLGVVGYGTVTSKEKDNFIHRFFVNGEEKTAKVSTADNYALQNKLAEGYVYSITAADGVVTGVIPASGVEGVASSVSDSNITVDGSTVAVNGETKAYAITTKAGGAVVTEISLADVSGKTVKVYGDPAQVVYQTFVAQSYKAPVSGTPGLRTVKNYLATALEPVGTSLYVYGGAWDWQDSNSSPQARTIGIPQTWIDFFQQQDAGFTYKNSENPASSYYPHNSWNQYYFAGPDCSGYVGWSVYNVMNTQSGQAD